MWHLLNPLLGKWRNRVPFRGRKNAETLGRDNAEVSQELNSPCGTSLEVDPTLHKFSILPTEVPAVVDQNAGIKSAVDKEAIINVDDRGILFPILDGLHSFTPNPLVVFEDLSNTGYENTGGIVH